MVVPYERGAEFRNAYLLRCGAGRQFIVKAITLIALVKRLKICLEPAPLRGGILGKHFIYCLSIAIMGSQLHH